MKAKTSFFVLGDPKDYFGKNMPLFYNNFAVSHRFYMYRPKHNASVHLLCWLIKQDYRKGLIKYMTCIGK